MKFITAHKGKLFEKSIDALSDAAGEPLWAAWGRPSMLGQVHEFVYDSLGESTNGSSFAAPPAVAPCLPALAFGLGIDPAAPGSAIARGGLMWFDTDGTLYPPALAAEGVPLSKLYLLRVRDSDVVRTAGECLNCRGVGMVVAPLRVDLTRVEARRLQLAAETGGGIGLLLRSARSRSIGIYAAATRWRISPVPGERTIQRWKVELLHGQGRRLGDAFILEKRREPHFTTGDEQRFYAAELGAESGAAGKTDPVRALPAVAARKAAAEPVIAAG